MPPASAPTLLFENVAGQILADPAGFLRSHWSANARTLADTQAFLRALTKGMRQYGWPRALVNQVVMQPFTAPEQAWVTQEWQPEAALEAGYRASAIVLATNIYSRLATAFVTTNVQGLALRYRSFDDEAEAITWLLKQG